MRSMQIDSLLLDLLSRPQPSARWTRVAAYSTCRISIKRRTSELLLGVSNFGNHLATCECAFACESLGGAVPRMFRHTLAITAPFPLRFFNSGFASRSTDLPKLARRIYGVVGPPAKAPRPAGKPCNRPEFFVHRRFLVGLIENFEVEIRVRHPRSRHRAARASARTHAARLLGRADELEKTLAALLDVLDRLMISRRMRNSPVLRFVPSVLPCLAGHGLLRHEAPEPQIIPYQ
ncbi:hypothetical protein NP88_76 [Burkholderia cepacia]|nr:hypothetical protein NP88_76 [Burkholderia cepacia]SPU97199.1 Uncharacterised protein [Burkholderia cenocepacia]SPV12067.1 Uncharacterised protein [Burkholderia cenocepacia]